MYGDIFNNEIAPSYKAINIRRRLRTVKIYVGTYDSKAALLWPHGEFRAADL